MQYHYFPSPPTSFYTAYPPPPLEKISFSSQPSSASRWWPSHSPRITCSLIKTPEFIQFHSIKLGIKTRINLLSTPVPVNNKIYNIRSAKKHTSCIFCAKSLLNNFQTDLNATVPAANPTPALATPHRPQKIIGSIPLKMQKKQHGSPIWTFILYKIVNGVL